MEKQYTKDDLFVGLEFYYSESKPEYSWVITYISEFKVYIKTSTGYETNYTLSSVIHYINTYLWTPINLHPKELTYNLF